MKTINALSSKIIKSNNIDIIEKIILYRMVLISIYEITSTTLFKIEGDITSYLADNDYIIFPMIDFINERSIDSISFDGTYTNITLNAAVLDSTYLNTYIGIKNDISEKLIKDGIKDVIIGIEGINLNSFDSGKLDFITDNSDGYFNNSNKTGIMNLSYIYFVKYTIYLKGSGDMPVVYFGGMVSNTESAPDYYNRNYMFRCYGHSKELERYPTYSVCDTESRDLIFISGMSINNFISSDQSEEGVKTIKFMPFTTGELSGITVKSVSIDTLPGIKKLEFKYPNKLKWDNGDWNEIIASSVDSNGDATLTAYNTSTALVNFGSSGDLNSFPAFDSEIWVWVETKLRPVIVKEQGKPIAIFDDGSEEVLKIHFQTILKYDDSTGTYTDISDLLNSGYTKINLTAIFEAVDDEIIIIAPEVFWGIEFLFNNNSVGDVYEFYYSTGGNIFSAAMSSISNGLEDNSNNFTQAGVIRWNKNDGWTPNDITDNSTYSYKGFMIKIKKITSVSSGVNTYEVKRIIRMRGKNNDFLEIKIDQKYIATNDTEDNVILQNINDEWTVGIWYQNNTIKNLLAKTLNTANYDDSNIEIDDIKVVKPVRYFNIWGKLPRLNYKSNPSAIYSDGNVLYIGIGEELWIAYLDGTLIEKVATIYYNQNMDRELKIIQIWKSSNIIHIVATDYDYLYNNFSDSTSFDNPIDMLPDLCIWGIYEYDTLTEIITLITLFTEQTVIGKLCKRDGGTWSYGGFYYAAIGQQVANYSSLHDKGENLVVAYPQPLFTSFGATFGGNGKLYALHPSFGIDEASGQLPDWYFWNDYDHSGVEGISGPKFMSNMIEYCIEAHASNASTYVVIGICFSYGQKGCLMVNKTLNKVYTFDNAEFVPYVLRNITDNTTAHMAIYDRTAIPISHHWDETNGIIYFSYIHWYDLGTATKSYSYITRWKEFNAKLKNWDMVFAYDKTTDSYTDVTSDVNAGTNIADMFDEVDDALYIGSLNKFKSIVAKSLDDNGNDYRLEYFDGSTWQNIADTIVSPNLYTKNDFNPAIKRDWAETAVDGNTMYWFRIRMTIYDTTTGIDYCYLTEDVIWDSELDNSGELQRYMAIDFVKNDNENTLHGCMFNRETNDSYPYQWCYFVLDLSDNTLYISRTGNNFTFNPSLLYNKFVYNNIDHKVYCVTEDVRYKINSSVLISATYSSGVIILVQEGIPKNNEYGMIDLTIDSNGGIYGITKDKNYVLWEYNTEFYQRIELADFSSFDTIRDLINEFAKILNYNYIIHSERIIRFITRDSYNGNDILIWNENMVKSNPEFSNWEYFYDAVKVTYKNLINDEEGDKKNGFDIWLKKVLTINSPLIQNIHHAKLVSETAYAYYNNYRISVKDIFVNFLFYFENLDKVNIVMPSSLIDISSNIDFIINKITKNGNGFKLDVLEKI